MATVTKPIALDESFNTTEQTPRSIADVLAEELSAMITAIGGLNFINFKVVAELPTTGISTTTIYLVPSDDPQSGNTYDEYINLNGTVSGWEKIGSTDIDLSGYYTSAEVDALLADKADVSDIPTVNDGMLTIQQNGETKGTFTANQSENSTVNIEIPTTDIQTAVDEFSTFNGGLLSECIIELVPVQSGSGDPSPDNVRPISGHTEADLYNVGKNRLPLDITTIKSINTSGTWSGNEYTFRGVTFTINTDSLGNIISVNANGTASGNAILTVVNSVSLNENYIVSGCPSGGSYNSSYSIWAISQSPYEEKVDSGAGVTITSNYSREIRVRIASGYNAQNILFKPMIRLSTETDPTFVPYNGYQVTVNLGGTYYGGTDDSVSGVMVATYGMKDLGLLNWSVGTDSISQYFYADVSDIKKSASPLVLPTAICEIYKPSPSSDVADYSFAVSASTTTIYIRDTSIADVPTFVSRNTGYKIVYELATPQTIQLSPTMVKALVGENHLSAPLEGQEITESKYKKMFTFDDVIAYIQSLS